MTELERVDQLLKDAQNAYDRSEIENLFGSYMYLHSLVQDSRTLSFFAQTKEDIRIDLGNGIIEGREDLAAYFASKTPLKGQMLGRSLVNPMIVVAGDGETAKGLWVTAGHDTFVTYEEPDPKEFPFASYMEKHSEYDFYKMTQWVWHKYGVDFVKEDGKWKIWHIRQVEIMRCSYEEDWIDFSISRQYNEIMAKFNQPWQGVTRENSTQFNFPPTRPSPEPNDGYTITMPVPDNPKIPEEYATFSETFAY